MILCNLGVDMFCYQSTSWTGMWGFLRGPFLSLKQLHAAIDDRMLPPGTQIRIFRYSGAIAQMNEFTITEPKTVDPVPETTIEEG